MLGTLAGLAAGLLVIPGGPLVQQADWCIGPNTSYKQNIAGCTALIQSGQITSPYLGLVYFKRGNAYLRTRQYDQAIDDFTAAITLEQSPWAFDGRASANHVEGRDEQALPDADRAVALGPGNVHFLETRAAIFEKLGRRDEAVADYLAALKIEPTMPAAKKGLKRLGAAR